MNRIQSAIPEWNDAGVLPPIDEIRPTSVRRSPYKISLSDLIQRLGSNEKRRYLLARFLEYRSALHNLGLNSGFQWIDGSFVENIERIQHRNPRDIDVVTFAYLPTNQSKRSFLRSCPNILNPILAKERYNVHAFFVHLDILEGEKSERLVASSAYWYSLFSHQRNLCWKGFLRVDLSPEYDKFAKSNLQVFSEENSV